MSSLIFYKTIRYQRQIMNAKFTTARVRQSAYVGYVRTPNFIGVRMIFDMRTLTRTLIFSL